MQSNRISFGIANDGDEAVGSDAVFGFKKHDQHHLWCVAYLRHGFQAKQLHCDAQTCSWLLGFCGSNFHKVAIGNAIRGAFNHAVRRFQA